MTSAAERIVTFLLDPGRRFRGLILLAYGTGFAGLGISLFPGPLSGDDGHLTLAIVLMSFAFMLLFYLSVTVPENR